MLGISTRLAGLLLCPFFCLTIGVASESTQLSEKNWDQFVPAGKEVDAIYGDYVLTGEGLIAVIAEAKPGRHANLTIKNVGGALIDFTFRKDSNDQLGAFFPGAGRYAYDSAKSLTEDSVASLVVTAPAAKGGAAAVTKYRLAADPARLVITTEYHNPHQESIHVDLIDALRADKGFQLGVHPELNLFWVYDDYWDQAYGLVAVDRMITADAASLKSGRPFVRYAHEGTTEVTLAPGERHVIERCFLPGRNLLDILQAAHQLAGSELNQVSITVHDSAGPVHQARVELMLADKPYGWALTPARGALSFALPAGEYKALILAEGRPAEHLRLQPEENSTYRVQLLDTGTVVATIQDENGKPVPCKVEFLGQAETPTPYFGPDTAEHGVRNLYYSHNGTFRQALGPGKYDVIISHGPEYDAIFTEIEVKRGQETPLVGKLVRSVDTRGWLSADFHSHASPSGDNTSSQLGRVLNLLCEHLEFAPCTEHARITSYTPHLKLLGVEHLMATCPGMELTGSPLPINHQNAFPLLEKPRTQNGGGPETDANPVVQIERLAMWDNGSDKLLQQNHPNLHQILGDKDLDGMPDGGFEKMFGFMDVVEVHPPSLIFDPLLPREDLKARPNCMHTWMQMYNLGYRVPGVVNTDAHYNFHGSGPLRNFIRANDDPAQVKIMDLVHASEHGQIVMTNGPFLQVELTADERPSKVPHEIGSEVHAPDGKVQLLITVRCPNWFDVNRVQVFVNGRPDKQLNFTRKTSPKYFAVENATFFARVPLVLKEDAHLIVATCGEGLTLGRVMGPSTGQAMPVAVANPIFVDLDGQGFKPNGDQLGIPLPLLPDHKPSLNHSHPHHHHHGAGHQHEHPHQHRTSPNTKPTSE